MGLIDIQKKAGCTIVARPKRAAVNGEKLDLDRNGRGAAETDEGAEPKRRY